MTTSPERICISRKTRIVTRNNVGTINRRRFRRYSRMVLTPRLFIQPCRDHPVHHGIAYFRCKALQVWLMDMIRESYRDVHIVRLIGYIALDVVDNALALLGIQLPPLGEEHSIELGVVDMATVVRLARIENTVQIIIHLQEGSDRSHGELLELPQEGGRDIIAVLLGLQFDLDAHLAQLIHCQLIARRP